MSTAASNPPSFRSGFVALIGRPNVGKSTLLNGLLGQPVLAVSAKPQTTHFRQLGILTREDVQIVFVDTPGIHQPIDRLGEYMDDLATGALGDADLGLVLFDASEPPTDDDRRVAERINFIRQGPPILAALNKVDLLSAQALADRRPTFEGLVPDADLVLPLSAIDPPSRDKLLLEVIARLPSGPKYYPDETITDRYERDLAADLIRAAALECLRDEVPHSIAVRVDEFEERQTGQDYIAATLFVERSSQKGIVIGKSGSMIRQIGTRSRASIEQMSGREIYLDLRVKVMPNWRSDETALREFGYLRGNK
ncbi:MAG: GTPase Era [Anaerolineales bacterium]